MKDKIFTTLGWIASIVIFIVVWQLPIFDYILLFKVAFSTIMIVIGIVVLIWQTIFKKTETELTKEKQ